MLQGKKGEKYYLAMALLNYAREEVLINSPESQTIIESVDKLKIEEQYKDLIFLKRDILKLKNRPTEATKFRR